MTKIYSLKDPITNQVRYIGKTQEILLKTRLTGHVYEAKNGGNLHKRHWFEKLAKLGLLPIISLIEEVEDDKANNAEIFYIAKLRKEGDIINISDGGDGYTSEFVKDLWKNSKYREYHTERVKGTKNPFYGRRHTEETKEILREKCPHKGIEHPMFGKRHTKETIEKVRLNQPTLKTINRCSLNGEVIDTWVGIKEMCRNLELNDSAVIRVAKGRAKKHKGFVFKYAD